MAEGGAVEGGVSAAALAAEGAAARGTGEGSAAEVPSSFSVPNQGGGANAINADANAIADILSLLPIVEVVIGFGSSDPNAEEAAEAAAREEEAGGRAGGGEVTGGKVLPWERLGRSLNPPLAGGDAGQVGGPGAEVFLWYRRGVEDDSLSWSSHSLAVRRETTCLVQ